MNGCYAHCMSWSGHKCSCGRSDQIAAQFAARDAEDPFAEFVVAKASTLQPDDLLTARVFATPAGKVFLAYAEDQGYGPALIADVNLRVARCSEFWNTKP